MARYHLKLSIIIPYFELKEYTDELLKALAPQVTPEVEIILVDDGSSIPFETDFEWLKVIRKENGGAGSARNVLTIRQQISSIYLFGALMESILIICLSPIKIICLIQVRV